MKKLKKILNYIIISSVLIKKLTTTYIADPLELLTL